MALAYLLALVALFAGAPAHALSNACTQLTADFSGGVSRSAGDPNIYQPQYSGFSADEEIFYHITTTGSDATQLNAASPGDSNSNVAGIATNNTSPVPDTRPYGGHEANLSGSIFLDPTEDYYFYVQGSVPPTAFTGSVTMTAVCRIQAPRANNVSRTVVSNSSNNTVTLSFAGGAPTSISTPSTPAHGTVTISGTTITYTPTSGYIGADSFTYNGTNSTGTSTTATVSITVTGSAPVAGNVSTTVAAGSSANPVTLSLSGGAATSVTVASAASHGTATASGTSITYTPTTGYHGADSFTYTATNAAGTSSAATVTVTVTAPTLTFSPTPGTLPGGTVGTAYSQTITSSGGTSPYSYTATGLPAGLTLNSATGAITGTPTTAGSYSVTVTATDSSSPTPVSASANYTIAVVGSAPVAGNVSATVAANSSANAVTLNLSGGTATSVAVASAASHGTATASGTSITYTPTAGYSGADSFTYTATNASGTSSAATVSITVTAPTIVFTPTPGALPGGTVGTSYSRTITASGGTGPYTYTATGLPAGLSISSSGAITGTPTTAGSYSVTVGTTDANGVTGSANYTIAVAVQAPVANAVSATVNTNSSSNPVTLNITGGAATSVTVAGAASHGTAAASGTSITYTPTAGYSGADSFTYTATNASGTSSAATVSITVTAPTIAFSPTPGTLPGGTVGTAYSQTISASGGTGPYAYTATGLPAGLSISSSGAITGTPTTAGSYSVTVSTTDANGITGSANYAIAVAVQAPVANAVSTTVAANSSANGITLNITGGAASSVAVASAASHGTATASGTSITYTPTAGYSGADSFTYTATNASGTSSAATVSITVTAPTLAFSPAPGALPGGTVGTSYSQTIAVSGGTGPYSYTATGLPAGLTLNTATGAVTGTPTTAGSYNVSVGVTDAHGATGTASYTITIAVQPPVANAVSTTVAANSSANGVTLSITGGAATSVAVASAPAHGTATASGTSITYTPTAGHSGADSFTYTATNASGTSAAATVTVTVTATPLTFSPTPGTLPGGTVGTAYSQTISVSGGTGPYSFSATGLPAGLTLNTATGVVSGTPTTAGSFTVNVGVTDANGATSSATYTVTIAAQLPVAGAVSTTVAANSSANPITLNLSGGAATSVAVASAPAHGTATASGTSISYTPTAGYSGADGFTYTATNASGTSSAATVSITVTAPTIAFSPAPGALPGGTVGTSYSRTISVSGGTGPYSYTATGLPTGLTLNTATGAVTGTPTTAGSYSVSFSVTDAHGATGAASYTIAIAVQAPVANAVSTTVAANSSANAVTLNVTGGAATSVAVASVPAHGTATASGTSITYTPAAGYSGADSFTYTATNASGTSSAATVSITVTAPTIAFNPAPGALPGGTVGTSYSQALGVSGGTGPYSYSATGLPAGLTLNTATGAVTGTPTTAGSYALSVSVTDAHGATGSASYSIVIGAQAPTAGAASMTVAANSSGNPVTLALSGGAATSVAIATQPAHGTVSVSGTVVTYTPAPGYSGTDSFTYTATNASGTSSAATVSVAVTAPTLAFTPAPGALPGGAVGTSYSQTVSATGGTGPYSYTATGLPAGLTLNPATGAVTGTPTTAGSYTLNISVTDGYGATGTASYTIAIAAPPAPIAADSTSTSVPANTTTQAGQNVSINLSALVTGQYDDIRIVTQPRHGTVTISRTLAMRGIGSPFMMMAALGASSVQIPSQVIAVYTPEAGYQGADSFQYVVAGPGGTSAAATVSIQVIGRAPTAQAKTVGTTDGQAVSVDLTAGATDGPFTAATIVDVTPANQASATITAEGATNARTFRLQVTPKARFGGAVVVRYTLTNAFGTSAPATVTVNVTARPDPSADATVRAISDAQAETARRFSRAQVSNFMSHAEALHGLDCGRLTNGVRIASSDTRYDQRRPGDAIDPTNPGARNGAAARQTNSGGQSTGMCSGRIGVWAGGTIDIGTRDAVTGRSKINATTAGLSAGIDVHVAKGVTLGVGGGLGHDSSSVAGNKGHVGGDTKVVAAYASLTPVPGLFVDGMIARGWLDFDTRRLDATSGLTTLGNRDGRFTTGALSAGIDRISGALRWSVYGRGEYMDGRLDGYRENGAGMYDLRFDDRGLRSVTGVLGFRTAWQRPLTIGRLSATLRGEWQHEFSDGRSQGLDYADVTGASYYRFGALGWAREQFVLAPGFGLALPSGWELGADIGVRIADGERAATTGVKVRKTF